MNLWLHGGKLCFLGKIQVGFSLPTSSQDTLLIQRRLGFFKNGAIKKEIKWQIPSWPWDIKGFPSRKAMEEISETKMGIFDYIKISSIYIPENVK